MKFQVISKILIIILMFILSFVLTMYFLDSTEKQVFKFKNLYPVLSLKKPDHLFEGTTFKKDGSSMIFNRTANSTPYLAEWYLSKHKQAYDKKPEICISGLFFGKKIHLFIINTDNAEIQKAVTLTSKHHKKKQIINENFSLSETLNFNKVKLLLQSGEPTKATHIQIDYLGLCLSNTIIQE